MNNPKVQEQKVGVGIKILSILNLVIYFVLLFYSLFGLVYKDRFNFQTTTGSTQAIYSSSNFVPLAIISALMIISVILILLKNMVGVVLYFLISAINIIYPIIKSGFVPSTLYGLILPVIMVILIYKKRSVFKIKR